MRGKIIAGPSRLACRQLHSSSTSSEAFGINPIARPRPKDPREIYIKDRTKEDYTKKPVKENRMRSPDDPEVPEELRYRPPQVPVDIEHPRFGKDRLLDFKARGAELPPHLAIQKQRKNAHARAQGIAATSLNRVPKTRLTPRPDVPVRMESRGPTSKVDYTLGQGVATKEKQAYFEDKALGGLDWSVDTESAELLTPGRVVETRR